MLAYLDRISLIIIIKIIIIKKGIAYARKIKEHCIYLKRLDQFMMALVNRVCPS